MTVWDGLAEEVEGRGGATGRVEGEPAEAMATGRFAVGRGAGRRKNERGEHGALLVETGRSFYCPAYPLEEVFDPTGAGDSFAGGFLGYIARTGDTSSDGLRRAMVFGAAMGSFAVASFGIGGFDGVTPASLHQRVGSFKDLTHFEIAKAVA